MEAIRAKIDMSRMMDIDREIMARRLLECVKRRFDDAELRRKIEGNMAKMREG